MEAMNSVARNALTKNFLDGMKINMDGECEICGDHTLECECAYFIEKEMKKFTEGFAYRPPKKRLKVSILSDLHGQKPTLPGGDLLIIAGDLTARDRLKQHIEWCDWMMKQDYKKIIFIAGNHDNKLRDSTEVIRTYICTKRNQYVYLQDSGTEFEGWKIWGTPWSLWFDRINPECAAFTAHDLDLEEKYALIPEGTDIIISHTPPYGILDQNSDGYHCGSRSLRNALDRVKPKYCIFGHIHECGGQQLMYKHQGPNTWCINASIMDKNYKSAQLPIHIEI